MAAIPRDKINYHKVSKYANVLIFKDFYPKTKNVSYYLKLSFTTHGVFTLFYVYWQLANIHFGERIAVKYVPVFLPLTVTMLLGVYVTRDGGVKTVTRT